LKIEDTTQPLLISKPSKKDRRAGQTGPLMLIPELCCVTGRDLSYYFNCNYRNIQFYRHIGCYAIGFSIHEGISNTYTYRPNSSFWEINRILSWYSNVFEV